MAMEKGQRVKIVNTNSFWDGKEGVVEDVNEDESKCTIFVDFKPEEGKRVRQDFKTENVEALQEAYKDKSSGKVGELVKDFKNGFGLLQATDGSKAQVKIGDLEDVGEQEQQSNLEVVHLEQAQSFKDDLDRLDSKGRFKEFEWLFDEEGGSVGILRLKGFEEATNQGRVELETRSSNNRFNNPNNITVYALKKGTNSHNQFRAYFYRKGNTCVFVRGHIKKQDKNGSQEYKCIQDTIDHASKTN